MKTKNKKTKGSITPVKNLTILSLFCAAAGVYAADTDGWKYKDTEKTIIENTGLGTIPRIAPIEKDGKFDDDTAIGSVSKVEMSSGKADFVYDIPSLKDAPLKGVVFDGTENSLNMASGAKLNVDASIARDGNPTEGRDAVGIEFSSDATSASITGEGEISVKASANSTAISGVDVGDITAKSISAESAKGNANVINAANVGNVTASELKSLATNGEASALNVSGNAGNINVATVEGSVDVTGNAGDMKITTQTGYVSIGGTANSIDITTANNKVSVGSVTETLAVADAKGDVTVTTSVGAIDVTLNGGNLEAGTATVEADVAVDGKGNATVGTAGSVTVAGGLTGDLNVTTTVGTVNADTIDGNATIAQNTDLVNVDTITGKLTASDAKADIAVNSADSVDVNLNKSTLNAGTIAKDTSVNGEGNANVTKTDSLTINSLKGAVSVGELVKAYITTLDGNATITKNTEEINVADITGKLTVSNAGGNVNVTNSAGALDVNLVNGTELNANTVVGESVVNGKGNATITTAKNNVNITNLDGSATISTNEKDVNVDVITGTLKVDDAQGNVSITTSANAIDATLNGGNLNAAEVAGDVAVDGTGNATVGTAGSVTVAGGLTGDLNVATTVGAVNADTIDGNATIAQNTDVVNVDTITGTLSAADATKDVNVTTSAGAIDATLNGGNLKVDSVGAATVAGNGKAEIKDATSLTVTTTDGALSMSGQNVKIDGTNLDVDVTTVADGGNVTVNGTLDSAKIENVAPVATESATVNVGNVTGTVDVKTSTVNVEAGVIDGSVTIDSLKGNVSLAETKSTVDIKGTGVDGNVTINNALGNVTAESDITCNATVSFGNDSNMSVTNIGGNADITLAGGTFNATGEISGTADIKGFGEANLTVKELSGLVAKDVTIDGDAKKLTSEGDKTQELVSSITVKSGNFGITEAESVTTTGNLVGNLSANKVTGDTTIAKVDGDVTLGDVAKVTADTITGATTITTATGDVAITNGADVNVTDANGNVTLGEVAKVTIGDIAADKTLKVETSATDVAVDGLGNADIKKADSVTVANSLAGTLNIEEVGTVDVATVKGATTIGTATGNVEIDNGADVKATSVGGNLTLGDVANVTADSVAGNTTITTATGAVELGDVKSVEITTANKTVKIVTADSLEFSKIGEKLVVSESIGSINAANGTVKDVDIAKNTGDINIGTVSNSLKLQNVAGGESTIDSAGSVDATINSGKLNVNAVSGDAKVVANGGETKIESANNANVTANAGTSIFTTIKNKLTALLKGGDVEAQKVATAEISGNAGTATLDTVTTLNTNISGATVDAKNVTNADLKGTGNVNITSVAKADVHTTQADKFVASSHGGITTNGALNVDIVKGDTVAFDKVNGGDIQGMTDIKNLNVASNVGELNIGTTADVKGNIKIADSSAQVNIGNITGDLNVKLSNDANLVALDGTKVNGKATVNGGCDATYYDVTELVVDSGLDGKLTVNGTVGTANVKNVTDGFTVANATGLITVENTNIEVTKKVADIKANSDVTLSNTGSAELSGIIDASAHTLNVKSENFNVSADTNGAVIKANKITGEGAKALVHNYYNQKYGFSATDDSLINENTLIGTHDTNNVVSKNGFIDGTLESSLAVTEKYIDVNYSNTANDGSNTSRVNYSVTRNSYLEDAVAKTENEKAIAKIYDNLEFQNDAAKDAESVAKKWAIANGGSSVLSMAVPQSVVHAARLNMDLGDMMHLDTIYRTSATRDLLNAYGKPLNKHVGAPSQMVRGTTTVSVRNMNRFSSYSGDANISGSDDYIYGGLANVEYIANEDFFAGLGIGGFEAKSEGKGTSGKAETQSIALNLYGDYAFYPNFDWYFGVNYAFGMNEADRKNLIDESKAKWDSNLIGVFTGVRYAWKPYADKEFYVKPMVGVNANFLLNPSFDEDTGAERLGIDSENYMSVKSLVGVEVTYAFLNGFHVAGRMFYTHEFGDESYDVNASFLNSGSAISSFRVKGWEMDRDAGIFGIGVGYDISKAWSVYLDYAAEVSSDVYHNLNAGVKFQF